MKYSFWERIKWWFRTGRWPKQFRYPHGIPCAPTGAFTIVINGQATRELPSDADVHAIWEAHKELEPVDYWPVEYSTNYVASVPGEPWVLPPDPFDPADWLDGLDMSQWTPIGYMKDGETPIYRKDETVVWTPRDEREAG